MHFRGKELGMALNMVLNLHRLSFEHFLLLALDESSCQLALKAFPGAGAQAAHSALTLQGANVAHCQTSRHLLGCHYIGHKKEGQEQEI